VILEEKRPFCVFEPPFGDFKLGENYSSAERNMRRHIQGHWVKQIEKKKYGKISISTAKTHKSIV